MLFKDKLEEKTKIIRPEIDKLLGIALQNQFHLGDLLLFHVNGFYRAETLLWNANHPNNQFNPHAIGPGVEGYSENAHYLFMHKYRTNYIHQMSFVEFTKQFVMEKWDEQINLRNKKLIDEEATTIQLEMLIYLKFWEADMIIKKFFQFVRILNGEPYDWYFKIAESNRDSDSTGNRQEIIRLLIRDRIKKHSTALYQVIKDTYKTQIRNSIAHSNYSFVGRHIHLNNFIENDPNSQILTLSFDEWVDIFHNTIVLYNEYIRMNSIINSHYANLASCHGNIMEILVTEKDGKQYPTYIEYRKNWNDWSFVQNA